MPYCTAMQEEAEMYRAMWEQSMDECLDKLVRNGTDGLMYVGSMSQVWYPESSLLVCLVRKRCRLWEHPLSCN